MNKKGDVSNDSEMNYSAQGNYEPQQHQYSQKNGGLNNKQAYWIRKRKIRREMLDAIMIEQRGNYIHESRHRHAMKRLRAPSGRFLTKEESAKYKTDRDNR